MHIDLLRSVTIFRELSDDDLARFAELFITREIKAGERILEEGQVVKVFSIVCDGVVHVRRLAQKREMLLGRIGMGGFFGEINLFDPGVATASIDAMKPVRLASVDYESMRGFMAENPAAGYKIVSAMMAEMARRLRQTSARLVNSVYWGGGESGTEGRAT